jgi:murein L,D-transpeptidase YcbB/YkuD
MEGGMEERKERRVERGVVSEGGREERKVVMKWGRGRKGVVKLCGESPMVVVVYITVWVAISGYVDG